MKEDWLLGGMIFVLVAVVALCIYVTISDARRVGTSMVYRGETVVLIALQHEMTPTCYLVRRADGSTMLVPAHELTSTAEKP